MYQPAAFVETDTERLFGLVRAHPLGMLVTTSAQGEPVVDAVPFWLECPADRPARLLAHVARANPLWRTHAMDRPVLVVFQGPGAYISPNWYPTKAEHGKAVPTWNYTMVQARGRMLVKDGDTAWVRAFLTRLTSTHEAQQDHPWHLEDAPASYMDAMLQAVVGLEIEVDQWEGKFKLSQNQPVANQQGVRSALARSADAQVRDTLHWMAVQDPVQG